MIPSEEFKQRRKKVMREMKKRSMALIVGHSASVRNGDVEYPFRQDSDFLYLTGFDEPDAAAVFLPGREEGEFVLFCREFDETRALWTGYFAGLDEAVNQFGADQAYSIEIFADKLPELISGYERIYYPIGGDAELDRQVVDAVSNLKGKVRSGVRPPRQLHDLAPLIHEMRLYKSEAELEAMQEAIRVSVRAHRRAMSYCQPGQYEYEVEAEIAHEFMRHGLRSAAYPSIVAGGNNACVLHYTRNDAPLKDGDLLLIDAGVECHGYASDITRTFPVNGKFSEEQKLLYECVLKAQLAAIDAIRPDRRWSEPHDAAVEVLTRGLVQLGLLKGRVSRLVRDEVYKTFYMHKTGHWLGMDVHDVGAYKTGQEQEWRKFEPGMVLTVEPGLYISEQCEQVDSRWRGIGIRIEDNIVVTEDGCRVLTAGAPKTVDEIESLMRGDHD
ncbi:Xaa-Pro aminopeptidase [Candidatus Methylospira mobilis]|uniref:Xaa-Pro aminopeptidase n=1 Tax=Candidatus Methylospira mobilis TaxID=1808979 RepID=UPI0028E39B90|nr:Xaa-Pro aminopeptidase [Candidatus Methylospira mobilis]WNV03305.1 Xaa-Pro aminopeptidase [Candidatus Methylospira mobilis]